MEPTATGPILTVTATDRDSRDLKLEAASTGNGESWSHATRPGPLLSSSATPFHSA